MSVGGAGAGGRARRSDTSANSDVGAICSPPTEMSRSLSDAIVGRGVGGARDEGVRHHHRAHRPRPVEVVADPVPSPRRAPPRGCAPAGPTPGARRRARGRGCRAPRPSPWPVLDEHRACRRPASGCAGGRPRVGEPGVEAEPDRRSRGCRWSRRCARRCAASRARTSSASSTASTGGSARSWTSPETSTRSTDSAVTVSTRWSRNAAWASSIPTPWKDRPRCQSEVWRMRTRRP